MNKRDKEFAVQAGVGDTWNKADWYSISPEMLEKFAALIRADEREKCSRTRASKPRILPSVGAGMLWSEQTYCFDKGWHEGAAAVRKAIRARGQA